MSGRGGWRHGLERAVGTVGFGLYRKSENDCLNVKTIGSAWRPFNAAGMFGRRGTVRWVVLGLSLGAVACGPRGPVGLANARPEGVDVVWPQPPESPRVRLAATFSTASDLGFSRSFFRRVADFVFGGEGHNRIRQPYGVAVGADGSIYVVDTALGGVHMYDLTEPRYRLLGAGDLQAPVGIVATPEGRIYVSDPEQGAIVVFDREGDVVDRLSQGFRRPTGLAWDGVGKTLLVVDTEGHQVIRMAPGGAVLDRFGGRGSAEGRLNYPTNIAVDNLGRIYVSDTMNFRVQVFDDAGVYMGSFGEVGTREGQFARPKGVGVSRRGHVYVVEGLYDVVNIFDADGRLLLTFGGAGRGRGEFWLASGLAVDGEGRIYVADTYNSRIQVFEVLPEEALP